MIAYLLKSAICLTLLLAVYHLLLEYMKMHKFNRFYLLFSLAIGLSLPLITIEISATTLNYTPILSTTITAQQIPESVQPAVIERTATKQTPPPYNPKALLIFFYVLVAAGFASKFTWNILRIRARINKNAGRKINGASLVLLTGDVLPHSFLGYIFLNEHDYRDDGLDGQLLEHELAHVRQMHTWDILFIEMLKIVFWFNPVFFFYKKAIQLNHEFLADEAVLSRFEVSTYQYLLLERTVITTAVPLTSNLNYSLKKRLTMMIKTTSKLKTWTARLAVIPVLAAMLFLFSMKAIPGEPKFKPIAFNDHTKTEEDPDKEVFFKGATIWIENKEGKYMPRKYDEMTAAEKVALPAARLPKKSPTNELLASWKTQPETYAVWIDRRHVNNSDLAKYKPEDFVLYGVRKPGKIDMLANKTYSKFPQFVILHTMSSYTDMFIKPYIKPGKWLGVYKGEIWPGGFDGAETIHKYFEVEELKKANLNYDKRWLLPPFKPEKIE
jgi:hypothetical protein